MFYCKLEFEALNITPSFTLQFFEGEITKRAVTLYGVGKLYVGDIIANLLKGSFRFGLFTATVGDSFQQFQGQMKKENNVLKTSFWM